MFWGGWVTSKINRQLERPNSQEKEPAVPSELQGEAAHDPRDHGRKETEQRESPLKPDAAEGTLLN